MGARGAAHPPRRQDNGGVKSLFNLVVPAAKANPRFLHLQTEHAFTAARRLMDEAFVEFPDVDHSFVTEFQTGGFSPRVFELALFCALREQNLPLDRTGAAPDFVLRGAHPCSIEATTSNPPGNKYLDENGLARGPRQLVPEDLDAAEREFVFQAGKALRRKLTKRDAAGSAYWELPHVAGLPFAIALESFHSTHSLFQTSSALSTYLFGRQDIPSFDAEGTLTLTPEHVATHEFEGKQIPSGLFTLPEAKHLAAVLFSNNATVNKFNRIGTELGYGPDDVAMIRVGSMWDPDPNAALPQPFGYLVGEDGPEGQEPFSEGWHVFHNPHTDNPLPPEALPAFAHHELLEDGHVLTTSPRLDPFNSQTRIFRGAGATQYAQAYLAAYLANVSGEAHG